MSKRDNKLLLEDILQGIEKIKLYTSLFDEGLFLSDEKTQDAVCRNFSVIGEAASRLTEDFKSRFNTVNWRVIKDFRNKIIHDYMGTDYTEVWKIVQVDLPNLATTIEAMIRTLDQKQD
jgi:uncharacterized protein with HEPN domain